MFEIFAIRSIIDYKRAFCQLYKWHTNTICFFLLRSVPCSQLLHNHPFVWSFNLIKDISHPLQGMARGINRRAFCFVPLKDARYKTTVIIGWMCCFITLRVFDPVSPMTLLLLRASNNKLSGFISARRTSQEHNNKDVNCMKVWPWVTINTQYLDLDVDTADVLVASHKIPKLHERVTVSITSNTQYLDLDVDTADVLVASHKIPEFHELTQYND